jgi:uncharacterized membrane protein YeaQ/YmgE (transglycosylase-associated protein family)
MSVVLLIIIGVAAGFLATRLMGLELDIITTVVIGMVGALVGGLALQFLAAIMGALAGLVGAVLGAMGLIWLWKTYMANK